MWLEIDGVLRQVTLAELLAAAREWEALRAGLGLAPEATALGVVTEVRRLQAEVAAGGGGLLRLDGARVAWETAEEVRA